MGETVICDKRGKSLTNVTPNYTTEHFSFPDPQERNALTEAKVPVLGASNVLIHYCMWLFRGSCRGEHSFNGVPLPPVSDSSPRGRRYLRGQHLAECRNQPNSW